jgi:hypothetical protein
MSHDIVKVPYGYEPPSDTRKGTLIYYDSFEAVTDEDLERAAKHADSYSFSKLVLYPLHEDTVRRMSREPVSAYHKREKRLFEWRRTYGGDGIVVENWEGKRKKYTPFDTAIRHLTESHPSPYFLYVTPDMANLLASFSSFETWIVKLRLILTEVPASLHPALETYRHRWSEADKFE